MSSANTDGEPKVSFKNGRYEVINRIGGGSFGAVYLAFDNELKER